jgi:opacity protein-like surface antigen
MTLAPFRSFAVLALALGAALPAHAQDDRKAEVSVGYQLLTFNDDELDVEETLSKGWYADVAGNLGPLFAAVVQVGGSYKTREESETFSGVTGTATASLKVHQFLGGVRVGPRRATISPYAEFLVGGINGSFDVSASVVTGGQTIFSTDESDSGTNFAMQFGGGVTMWLSENVGLRGSVGLIRLKGDDEDTNVFRAAGGISFGF